MLVYYSFTTLTTLGYGDVLPMTDAARSAAVLEAVLGHFYLAVLVARPDVGAVVHTHSPRATADPSVPVAVGLSGTPELGAAVVEAAVAGHAVVIRDHGPVCFGADLAEALARAFELERAAT